MELKKLSNYYGHQSVKEENGNYFLSTPSYDKVHWQRIPQYLYDAIIKYEDEDKEPYL